MKCPYCGSYQIEEGIAWGMTAETGNIGLKFRKGIFGAVAEVYADLCLDCKTITRLYIKEETDKKWVHRPGSVGTK